MVLQVVINEVIIFLKVRREGEKFLIYTGPEGKPGGESRFPLSLKTDGVLKIQNYPQKKVRGTVIKLSKTWYGSTGYGY